MESEVEQLSLFFEGAGIGVTKSLLWAGELVNLDVDSVALLRRKYEKNKLHELFECMSCSKKPNEDEVELIEGALASLSFSPKISISKPVVPSIKQKQEQKAYHCRGEVIENVVELSSKARSSASTVYTGDFFLGTNKMQCIIKIAKDVRHLQREKEIFEKLRATRQETGCVELYDVIDSEPPYLVLEYGGESIANLFNSASNVLIIKSVVEGLVCALKRLHSFDIAHLDLKPDNIVYRYHLGSVIVRLIDLDNATEVGEPFPCTEDGCPKHTTRFACPEVHRCVKASRSGATLPQLESSILIDYFAMGLVCWQLLNQSREALLPDPTVAFIGTEATEYDQFLSDQAALWHRMTFTHGLAYATQIKKLCSIDARNRVGALEQLERVMVQASQTGLVLINDKLEHEIHAYLSSIDQRTCSIQADVHQLSDQLRDTETVLRRAVFEATEVRVPTCFIILNQKLEAEAEAVHSSGDSKLTKAKNWVKWLGSAAVSAASGSDKLVESKAIKAKSWGDALQAVLTCVSSASTEEQQSLVDSFLHRIGSEHTLYFYLVDELTGLPVEDPAGLYPIPINVANTNSFTSKVLPLLKLSYSAISVINSGAGLARCLGYPVHHLEEECLTQFRGLICRLDEPTSVHEFDALQQLVLTADQKGGQAAKTATANTVRGSALRELEKFYMEYDANGHFAGLRRVSVNTGDAQQRGVACWTLNPTSLEQSADAGTDTDAGAGTGAGAVTVSEGCESVSIDVADTVDTTSNTDTAIEDANTISADIAVDCSDSDVVLVDPSVLAMHFRGFQCGKQRDRVAIQKYAEEGDRLACAMMLLAAMRGYRGVHRGPEDISRLASRCASWLEKQHSSDPQVAYFWGCFRLEGVAGCIAKDEEEGVQLIATSAAQGYANAIYDLATRTATGEGVEKDMVEATRLYRLAADEGYPEAQCALGRCYLSEDGVAISAAEAFRLFNLSADRGCAAGQFSLAQCYDDGIGVDVDAAEAVRLYRLAADKGFPQALFALGLCYEVGKEVVQDQKEAVRMFRLSADLGDKLAQYKLGLCFESGNGIPEDRSEAERLFRLAADQGHPEAVKHIAKKKTFFGIFKPPF